MRFLFPNPLVILALVAIPIAAQTVVTEHRLGSPTLHKGIVVEWVTKNDEAQRAGMRAGDVLLRWRGAINSGQIGSPFELPYIGFEHAPRGAVRIEGLRRGEKRTWVLRTIPWGIAARPIVTDRILAVYLQAEELAHSGKLTEAVKAWRIAASMARESGIPWAGTWFLSHAGEALFRARQMEPSDGLYREAIGHAAESGPIVRGDLFRQWATQLEAREELVSAEKYYQQELLEWKRLGAELLVAKSLNALGILLLDKSDFTNAESYFVQSLSITERLAPAAIQRAVSYSNLAVLYQDRGDLGKAEKYYRLALAIGRKYFPGTYYLSGLLTDFGILARWRGNLALAEEYHRKALAIAEKQNLPENVANIIDNISDCRLERGDLAGARAYQERALSIREHSGLNLPVASSLAGLGKIARLEGKLDAAEDYYRRALEVANKVHPPPPERGSFLAGLADVIRGRGDFTEAERVYRQALAIMDELAPRGLDHAETVASLGATLRGEGHLEEAAEAYSQALGDLEYQTASMGALEEHQARYRAKHVRYYREYMALLIERGQLELAFEMLESSHARTLFEMLAQAQINVRQGADVSLLAREHDLHQSLTAKSQYRIRLLGGKHTDEQVRILDREIADLRESYQEIEANIRANSPTYAALTQPQPLSVRGIQQLLDPETILLEYSLGEERSYVWVVTENSLREYALAKQSEIERVSRRVYSLLTGRNRTFKGETEQQLEARWRSEEAEYSKTAAELSRMVLGPVSSLLAGKRLLVVSEGALQYIPFSALPAPDGGKAGMPLMVDHEIVNLPSGSVLAELRRQAGTRKEAPKAVAVLADPVFDADDERLRKGASRRKQSRPTEGSSELHQSSWSADRLTRSAADLGLSRNGEFYLSRLLYSRQEAESIMAVTPSGKGMKVLDFHANRSMAMSPELAQFRIVHFATHGLLDSKHPELSGLVFSMIDRHGKPQDGFLQLQDIYNLNLPVELVVLSACETGLGEEINGEGLIGLTRGFMYAGASRVVASLWNVSDVATSELMARFYKAMEQDKLRPAAALRAAQIQMWKQKQWRSPYYWAAFQLQGEWK